MVRIKKKSLVAAPRCRSVSAGARCSLEERHAGKHVGRAAYQSDTREWDGTKTPEELAAMPPAERMRGRAVRPEAPLARRTSGPLHPEAEAERAKLGAGVVRRVTRKRADGRTESFAYHSPKAVLVKRCERVLEKAVDLVDRLKEAGPSVAELEGAARSAAVVFSEVLESARSLPEDWSSKPKPRVLEEGASVRLKDAASFGLLYGDDVAGVGTVTKLAGKVAEIRFAKRTIGLHTRELELVQE